ncbi:hypothetical protein ACLOAV_007175 [Pseudogymnoascus australis]
MSARVIGLLEERLRHKLALLSKACLFAKSKKTRLVSSVRLFRNDHVGFWRDQVAQISVGSDLVYQALLSVGAIHRGLLLRCEDGSVEEASRSRVLGLKAYGITLRLLSSYLSQAKKPDVPVLLVVLTLLTYFECFQENPKGALQHLWAAIQFLPESEDIVSIINPRNMVPLYDAMLELDILAQKLRRILGTGFISNILVTFYEIRSSQNVTVSFNLSVDIISLVE